MFRVGSWVHIVVMLIYIQHQEKEFDGKYSQYSEVLNKGHWERQDYLDGEVFHDKLNNQVPIERNMAQIISFGPCPVFKDFMC